MQETWVQCLGPEDPLEEEMATHSSVLDWRNPWTEEPGRLQSLGSQRGGHDRRVIAFTHANIKNTGVGCHFLLQGFLTDPGIESSSPAL